MTTYTGTNTLENLADAKNYNAFIDGLLTSRLQQDKKILDFGAGIGTFQKRLLDAGYTVTGFEPDLNQCKLIQNKGAACVADFSDIEPESYDSVYTLNVLEHIPEDLMALQDIHQILRPNGNVIIYVPAFQILFSGFDQKIGHIRRYSKSDLSKKVTAAGFQIKEIRYADFLGFWAALLFKFVSKANADPSPMAIFVFDRILFPMNRVLDPIFSRFLGKNLFILAVKSSGKCQ